ncbi:MAG: hypothetical protein AB1765_05355 [Candidatus Hydrogenedentota bacterium]
MKFFERLKFVIEYIPFFILCYIFSRLPDNYRIKVSSFLGNLFYIILPLRKNVAVKNINKVFPDKDNKLKKNILRDTYKHFALFFSQFAYLSLNPELLPEIVDGTEVEKIERIYSGNNSLIIVTGHIGVWEIGGLYLNIRGLPVTILVKRQKNSYVASKLDKLRWTQEVDVLNRGDGLRQLVKSVKENKIPVMVGDQDGGTGGEMIPFFNKEASMTKGFAVLSYKYKIPVIPVFAVVNWLPGTKDYKIKMIVDEPIQPDFKLPKEEFVKSILLNYNKVLEKMINRYPDQYFWFHKRWKTVSPELYK